MLRALARAGLLVLLLASLAMTGLAGLRIARDPLLGPVLARTAAEITAATDRAMAYDATPARIAERLTALLAESPRNWIAVQAVQAVAAERGMALPAPLAAALQTAWDADNSYLTQAGACATCLWDAATCTLSQALLCNAPVTLTPIGDVAGLTRAGVAYASGGEIDQVDLALSVVGLGATVALVASGGTSLTIKAGAGLARLAHRMRLLTPGLLASIAASLRAGVDLAALPGLRSTDDLARMIRPAALAPLAALSSDLGRLTGAVGGTQALHLLRYIDTGTDARHLANAAEALGPRTVGRIEILGKSRLMRATLRWSDAALGLLAGLLGLLASLAALLGGMAQSLMLRALRRLARQA